MTGCPAEDPEGGSGTTAAGTTSTTGVSSSSTSAETGSSSTGVSPTGTTMSGQTDTDDNPFTSGSGGGFIYGAPDVGNGIDCATVAQDCPPGEKCVPWAADGGPLWSGTRCVESDPNAVGVGESCAVESSPVSGLDNCEAGAVCALVDARTLMGTCVLFCGPENGDMPCPVETDQCTVVEVTGVCLP